MTSFVESALDERAGSAFRLGLRAAAERFGGGQTQLGADAAAVLGLGSGLQLDVAAGVREGIAVEAPNGSVESSAMTVAVALQYLLVDADPLELAVEAGSRAAWARFRGRGRADATEGELSGMVAYARGGLALSVRVAAPIWLELAGTLGAPLRALTARDGSRTVTGLSGAELAVRAGVAAEF